MERPSFRGAGGASVPTSAGRRRLWKGRGGDGGMVSDGEKEGRWPPESAFGATARPNKVNFYPITLKLGHKPPVDVVWRRVWPAKPYGEFEGPLAKRSRMKHRNGGKFLEIFTGSRIRHFPNPDFDFHDKNHGNFIFNSTLTPLTGDLTSPKHIINHPNSRISGGHM